MYAGRRRDLTQGAVSEPVKTSTYCCAEICPRHGACGKVVAQGPNFAGNLCHGYRQPRQVHKSLTQANMKVNLKKTSAP
eukprot:806159-Amphidinium_carterae.1